MSRRTSGIDDLVRTLIRQHGVATAVDVARNQCAELRKGGRQWRRFCIWSVALSRLKEPAPQTFTAEDFNAYSRELQRRVARAVGVPLELLRLPFPTTNRDA
jgi:hypothetical protein